MDILSVILLIVVLILIVNNKAGINQKFNDLEFRIIELQNLLKHQDEEITEPETSKTYIPSPITAKPQSTVVAPVELTRPVEIPPQPIIERQKEIVTDSLALLKKPIKTWEPTHLKQKESEFLKQEEPQLSFFERYPDLEKFIGENLINKVGIAILVLAIGFFVKYAIDNNWVGPVGRVGIGILCGGILIGFAHRMRNNYKAFSSVLVGGGIAIFYFTITLAFQEFHLFSQLSAFIILIIITVFAVILSLLYNKQELAVIALIGGFASPFMVSDGSANYSGLFFYLLILNTGLLFIAYYKAWRILNISSFVLSIIVFITIISTMPPNAYYIALRYATVFYLLFFTINIINNVRENKKFLAVDFTILLTNTALYFATGLYLLTEMQQVEYRGLFSASLGALNLLLSFLLYRNKKVDPNILYLLIGITLTFISLTAPIQLHGNNITLFWASEAVLLYWLYQKSNIKLMKLTSLIVYVAMMFSLILDVLNIYNNQTLQLAIITNKGFITMLFASITSYLMYILAGRDTINEIYTIVVNKNIYRIIALIILFLSGVFEIDHQLTFYYPKTDLDLLYLMLYVPFFVYLFNIISTKVYGKNFNWIFNVILLACTIIVYLALTPVYSDLLSLMLEPKSILVPHFMAHWVSDIFVLLLFYQLIFLCRFKLNDDMKNTAAWFISGAIVTFLSLELCLLTDFLFYSGATPIDEIQTVYIKTCLPILWGLLSFTLMWIGMHNKQRGLRIISLTLFLITLIKLFLFDINNIPVAGKIAAFFCLGILLLIISFMYQKVKKIIIDDEGRSK